MDKFQPKFNFDYMIYKTQPCKNPQCPYYIIKENNINNKNNNNYKQQ